MNYPALQYGFVQDSRKVLFDYCKRVLPEDFINENSSFGRGGSIRNLLVHIANTYEYWVANIALRKNREYAACKDYNKIEQVIQLFDEVDEMMQDFTPMAANEENNIEYTIEVKKNTTSPFKLFSHVITHEYHHKGQILSISRHLGYTPVDTDIL